MTQPSMAEKADVRRQFSARADAATFADRAENGIQLVSRWAGILAFVGAVATIIWLIT